MAQSPLSRLIQKLEHEVGALLFERNRRQVRMTEAGASLLTDVRSILVEVEAAMQRAREATSSEQHRDQP